MRSLGLFDLKTTQTGNITSDSDRGSSAECVTSSRDDFPARLALPDPGALSLDIVLSAKDAAVSRVLRDLDLAQQFTEGTTVPGSVLSGDSDLLGSLAHFELE
jgi:hypothetical protein